MKPKMTLQEHLGYVLGIAKQELIDTGEVSPVVFLGNYDANNEVSMGVVMPLPMALMRTYETKNILSQLIQKAIAEVKPDFFIFVTEAWVAKLEDPNKAEIFKQQYGQVKDMPNKLDCIMAHIETSDEQFAKNIIFEKKDDGTYNFSEQEMTKGGLTGRFANFLFKKPVKENKNVMNFPGVGTASKN